MKKTLFLSIFLALVFTVPNVSLAKNRFDECNKAQGIIATTPQKLSDARKAFNKKYKSVHDSNVVKYGSVKASTLKSIEIRYRAEAATLNQAFSKARSKAKLHCND